MNYYKTEFPVIPYEATSMVFNILKNELSSGILGYSKKNFYTHLNAPLREAFPSSVMVSFNNLYMPDAEEGLDAMCREKKPIWVE